MLRLRRTLAVELPARLLVGERARALPIVPLLQIVAVLWTVVFGSSPPSSAVTSAVVVIARPEAEAERWVEAEKRIYAELSVAGYEVRTEVGRDSLFQESDQQRRLVADELRREKASALVAIARRQGVNRVQAWAVSANLGSGYRRMDERKIGGDASVVALRVVEFLHANVARLQVSREKEPKEKPAPSTKKADPLKDRGQMAVRASGAVMQSPGGMGPLLGPQAAFHMNLWSDLELDAELLYMMSATPIRGLAGSVDVHAGMARMELQYSPLVADGGLNPRVGAGGGVMVAGTRAEANEGYDVDSGLAVIGLVNLGAGLAVRLVPRFWLTLSGRLGFAIPEFTLELGDSLTTRAGRPFMEVGVGFEWWWTRKAGR